MKKIKIFAIALLSILVLGSCSDDSGRYAEPLYTNSQKSNAITICLKASLDTSIVRLCDADGFSSYKDELYKLDYKNIQSMMDTLAAHDFGYLNDSLIRYSNRLAESCGSVVKTSFGSAIDKLVVYDLDELIKGNTSAITDYFASMQSSMLREGLSSQVSIRMGLFKVNETWEAMQSHYYDIVRKPYSFDIQGYIIDKMVNGIVEEMRCEEYLIRTDSTHRVPAVEMLAQ